MHSETIVKDSGSSKIELEKRTKGEGKISGVLTAAIKAQLQEDKRKTMKRRENRRIFSSCWFAHFESLHPLFQANEMNTYHFASSRSLSHSSFVSPINC